MLTCTCSSLTVCGAPQSSKATWMRQTLGWSVDAIDLHRFGWSARAQMEAVMDAVTTDSSYDALIGSSFGGLAVANARLACGIIRFIWCSLPPHSVIPT